MFAEPSGLAAVGRPRRMPCKLRFHSGPDIYGWEDATAQQRPTKSGASTVLGNGALGTVERQVVSERAQAGEEQGRGSAHGKAPARRAYVVSGGVALR